jgi:tRNA(fMet)-specific endonuclease VapC
MAGIRYIFDTDSVTYHQLERPTSMRRLAQAQPDTVATTVITLYEQLRGRLAAINRQQSDDSLQVAFQRLQQTHA